MSIECRYCERDLRGGHADDCPMILRKDRNMKSSEITEPGFYWWQCPRDEGPAFMRGRPPTIVQVGLNAFGLISSGDRQYFECFLPGISAGLLVLKLPGEFLGPLNDPFSKAETCTWSSYDDGVLWETECGNSCVFYDGGPKENNAHFCCYCARRIKTSAGESEP